MSNVLNTVFNPFHTTTPMPGLSDRYAFVNTGAVLESLQGKGFEVQGTKFGRVLKESRAGYQKHVAFLRRPGWELASGTEARICLINSHNGTGTLKLIIGAFRLVCENQLIASNIYGGAVIRHVGSLLPQIDEALERILVQGSQYKRDIEAMQAKRLTSEETFNYVKACAEARVGLQRRGPHQRVLSVNTLSAERPRRNEDKQSDLWTTYNRVQEAMVRGGIEYKLESVDPETNIANVKYLVTKQLKGIDGLVKANQLAFDNARALIAA